MWGRDGRCKRTRSRSRSGEPTCRCLARLVGVRREPVAPSVVPAVDLSRLVHAVTGRMDPVAGTAHLLLRVLRPTPPRRAYRLAPPREPLRMAVARIRFGSHPPAVHAGLRRLCLGG